jgi:HrpA-like RNA helicase
MSTHHTNPDPDAGKPTLLRKGFLREVRIGKRSVGPSNKELAPHRPIDYIMDWYAKRLNRPGLENRVNILESSTGSGKSTALPPEAFHRFFDQLGHRNIACTQPRVLTSIEIPTNSILPYHSKEALAKSGHASRVPLELGKNLGFQTGVVSKRPSRGIVYMTAGVLTGQLNVMDDKEFMERYSFIFLDEAHERSKEMDTILCLIRGLLRRQVKNPLCPFVVVMSATLDIQKFADYLLEDLKAPARYENIIRVEGFTYPITDHWTSTNVSNYHQAAVNLVEEIHQGHPEDFLEPGEEPVSIKVGGAEYRPTTHRGGCGCTGGCEAYGGCDCHRYSMDGPDGGCECGGAEEAGCHVCGGCTACGGCGCGGDGSTPGNESTNVDVLTLGGAATRVGRGVKKSVRAAKPSETVKTLRTGARVQRDILIFINGAGDQKKVRKGLEKLARTPYFTAYPVMLLDLASDAVTSENADYRALGADPKKLLVSVTRDGKTQMVMPRRRVIISTNVAETGVTIESAGYVIDTGFYKSAEFSPQAGCSMLVNKPVTQSQHRQRRGRVGRKGRGDSYSLFTEDTYSKLAVMQYPDMVKDQISTDLLTLLIRICDRDSSTQGTEGLRELLAEGSPAYALISQAEPRVYDLGLLDSPSTDSLHYALDRLYILGLIDPQARPTRLGILCSKFRFVTLEALRMVLSGYAWGAAISDLVTIAAFLTVEKGKVFSTREKDVEQFDRHIRAGEFSFFTSVDAEDRQRARQNGERSQMLIADDFIRCILIYEEIADRIQHMVQEARGVEDDAEDDAEDVTVPEDVVDAIPVPPKGQEVVDATAAADIELSSIPDPPTYAASEAIPTFGIYGDSHDGGCDCGGCEVDPVGGGQGGKHRGKEGKHRGDHQGQGGKHRGKEGKHRGDHQGQGGKHRGKEGKEGKHHDKDGKDHRRSSNPLANYLMERGIKWSGIVMVINARDELINMLAAVGLNPYTGYQHRLTTLRDENLATKMQHIRTLKQCIYEGYKMNLATWNAASRTYESCKFHIPIQATSDLVAYQPRYICYDSLFLRGDSASVNMYAATPGYFSVMDGYVEVDPNFEAVVRVPVKGKDKPDSKTKVKGKAK